jgi:hypothetical protein
MDNKDREVYDTELKRLVGIARTKPFSPFAEFMIANKGYRFIDFWGNPRDKWEVFGERPEKFRRVKV